VRLRHRGDGLHIEIGDDGIGGLDERRGSGVQGLRDRIGAVGGTLQISSPPNRGTVMRASLPIEPSDPLAPYVEGRLETEP
jgi:signal transduction histidine kinase